MYELTYKQNRTLKTIKEFINRNGFPPTLAELSISLGLKSDDGATRYLNTLVKKGFVERVPNVARGIRVLKDYKNSL